MKKEVQKVIKIVIINLITSVRLIGALVLPFIYNKFDTSIISLIIIFLFASDLIDGFLARHLHCATFFGSIMDAACDKLLSAVSFIILSIKYHFMLAPLAVEIAILYTIYSTYRYGGNVQSRMLGKVKTFVADLCVIFCFVLLSLPSLKMNNSFVNYIIDNTDNFIMVLSLIMLIFCLIALADYVMRNKEARKNPKCMEIKYEEKNRKKGSLILKQLFDTEYYLEHKDESIIKQFYIK